jgi:hypothetical protein
VAKSKAGKSLVRELCPPELLSGPVIPKESWEQARFVNWLERQKEAGRIKLFSHVANERRGSAARLAAWKLGTRKGVPDVVIVLPDGQCVWVEMKRVRNSVTTKEQREWVTALTPHACVAIGSDQAIRFVSKYFSDSQKAVE